MAIRSPVINVMANAALKAARGLIRFDGGLSLVKLRLGPGELVLDGGNAFRKFGDLVLQATDFPVRYLQFQEVFDIGKH